MRTKLLMPRLPAPLALAWALQLLSKTITHAEADEGGLDIAAIERAEFAYSCGAGQQPNEASTECVPCDGNTYSIHGVCVVCHGQATADHTGCLDCLPSGQARSPWAGTASRARCRCNFGVGREVHPSGMVTLAPGDCEGDYASCPSYEAGGAERYNQCQEYCTGPYCEMDEKSCVCATELRLCNHDEAQCLTNGAKVATWAVVSFSAGLSLSVGYSYHNLMACVSANWQLTALPDPGQPRLCWDGGHDSVHPRLQQNLYRQLQR